MHTLPQTARCVVGASAVPALEHAEVRDRDVLPAPGRLASGTLFHDDGMIATFDFADTAADRSAPLTADEVRDRVRRVADVDIQFDAFHGGLRFTDQARQAASYRRGRTLPPGDAAHVHSPNGGQGLNLGLMDAKNLGWKLAATIRGDAVAIDKLSDDRLAALLLRPDGVIAWAAAPGDNLQPTALHQALHTWFPQKR